MSNRGPSGYQPNAIPLSQTGSQYIYCEPVYIYPALFYTATERESIVLPIKMSAYRKVKAMSVYRKVKAIMSREILNVFIKMCHSGVASIKSKHIKRSKKKNLKLIRSCVRVKVAVICCPS